MPNPSRHTSLGFIIGIFGYILFFIPAMINPRIMYRAIPLGTLPLGTSLNEEIKNYLWFLSITMSLSLVCWTLSISFGIKSLRTDANKFLPFSSVILGICGLVLISDFLLELIFSFLV